MTHPFERTSRLSSKPVLARERGIVLPVALIMLAIVSVAGLMAAKNSATSEQFSNNLRTSQVARNGAESALRYCERVAINSVSTTPSNNADLAAHIAKIPTTKLANLEVTTIQGGVWNDLGNWAEDGANLIEVPLGDDLVKNPYCVIEPAEGDQFLITARGLSRNADFDDDGQLTNGAEVWLQSILTKGQSASSTTGVPL